MYQHAEAEGGSAKVAVSRAVSALLAKVSKLKPRKRFTSFQGTFVISDAVADDSKGAAQ
jgi:hypothetical protein